MHEGVVPVHHRGGVDGVMRGGVSALSDAGGQVCACGMQPAGFH